MLRPKKKITKKEIKRDPLLEKISQISNFVTKNSRLVTYIVIGLIVVIIFTFSMVNSKKKANIEAAGELGLAELSIENMDYDDAIVRLESLIDKYPRTKSSGMAIFLLAKVHLIEQEYDIAEEYFLKYIDSYGDDEMILAAAYSGLGICEEQKGNLERAAEYLEKAAEVAPYKFQKHEYYLSAARYLIKEENFERAESILISILNDEPDSRTKSFAEILYGQLEVLKG